MRQYNTILVTFSINVTKRWILLKDDIIMLECLMQNLGDKFRTILVFYTYIVISLTCYNSPYYYLVNYDPISWAIWGTCSPKSLAKEYVSLLHFYCLHLTFLINYRFKAYALSL